MDQGADAAVQDIIDHPVQTLACIVAGEYVMAYQLLKVTANLADIAITYTFDAKAGKNKWNSYTKPLNQLCATLTNKNLALRDVLKTSAMLAANIYAQHKMIHGLEQFYTVTQGKVTQFIQHNPFTAPEKYLLTPEGIILQSSIGINTQNSSPSLKSSARENEFFRWLKRMNKRAIKD